MGFRAFIGAVNLCCVDLLLQEKPQTNVYAALAKVRAAITFCGVRPLDDLPYDVSKLLASVRGLAIWEMLPINRGGQIQNEHEVYVSIH